MMKSLKSAEPRTRRGENCNRVVRSAAAHQNIREHRPRLRTQCRLCSEPRHRVLKIRARDVCFAKPSRDEPRGCGGHWLAIRGTRAQGRKLIESLTLFSHLANVGDAKSLVIHPASTTHFRMSAEDLLKAGITEGTIRLSIGLEDPDDLIEDLSRALYVAGKA